VTEGSGRRPRTGPSATRRNEERERLFAGRLDLFKRLYRWLNLTLIQQGVWPLLVVLAGAPAGPVAGTPLPWWAGRIAGPALAAVLAWLYLRQRPGLPAAAADGAGRGTWTDGGTVGAATGNAAARWALPVLAVMLAVARIAAGPADAAAKLVLFGLADAVAFQLIHFGVVRRSWADEQAGTVAAVGLFAASWGLGNLFLAAAGGGAADPALVFAGGAGAGFAIALLSLVAWRWLGGFWSATALHLIVVSLVLGFA
jgi:hypothetical protein